METMAQAMKNLQQKMKISMKGIIDLCKENNLKIKKEGNMGDNILILDFDKGSYEKAKEIVVKGCVEGISRVNSYDATKRIAIIF